MHPRQLCLQITVLCPGDRIHDTPGGPAHSSPKYTESCIGEADHRQAPDPGDRNAPIARPKRPIGRPGVGQPRRVVDHLLAGGSQRRGDRALDRKRYEVYRPERTVYQRIRGMPVTKSFGSDLTRNVPIGREDPLVERASLKSEEGGYWLLSNEADGCKGSLALCRPSTGRSLASSLSLSWSRRQAGCR